jgi:ribosomal protein L37E
MSKRKSYTAEFKLSGVKYAEENGNRSAGREYSVDERSVREWRKQKNVLNAMDRRKRARREGLPHWPELWENWMVNGVKSFTKTNRMRHATCEEVCKWVLESWNEVTPECVKNGFKRAKLHDYCDNDINQSNEDNTDNDSDETDCDDEELDLISDQYSDILEAFRIESDEEFDGFE